MGNKKHYEEQEAICIENPRKNLKEIKKETF
jgi:hypothetical protein